jgi:hypothetical protein
MNAVINLPFSIESLAQLARQHGIALVKGLTVLVNPLIRK